MRRIRMVLILLLVLAISVPVFAQDTLYEDPLGRFTTTIPASLTDASDADYGFFTGENGSIAVGSFEAPDLETAFAEALAELAPDVNAAAPVQSSDIPIPSGVWTQNIYVKSSGAIIAALGIVQDGIAYVVVAESPNTAQIQALTPDLNTVLLTFTIGEAVDLMGVEPLAFSDEMSAELESFVLESMETYQVPGAQVAVVQNGEIVYVGGFGERSIGGEPVDTETLFMIGSTTKSMTSFLIATLVDEGLLDWDTPVTDLLPDFALSDTDATAGLRVRDLMGAASGVPRFDIPLMIASQTPDDVFAELATIPLVSMPGEEFHYSNYMFAAAGFLAAAVMGSDDLNAGYAELMQERLFDPLGMTSTTLDFDSVIESDNHATSYAFDLAGDKSLTELEWWREQFVKSVAPAGAVWSNAEDMAKYMLMQLNGGIAPDGTMVVSEANLRETQMGGIAVTPNSQYGLGWFNDQYNGLTHIQHGGNTSGYTSVFGFLPDAQLGVLVLANRGLANNFGVAVQEYVYEQVFELEHDSVEIHLAAEQQLLSIFDQIFASIQTAPLTAEDAEPYLGQYERGVEIDVNDAGEVVLHTEFADYPLARVPGMPDTLTTTGFDAGVLLIFDDESVSVSSAIEFEETVPFVLQRVD